MSDLKFQEEVFKDVYQEATPLVEKHYAEIAIYKDIPLDPDVSVQEQKGVLN